MAINYGNLDFVCFYIFATMIANSSTTSVKPFLMQITIYTSEQFLSAIIIQVKKFFKHATMDTGNRNVELEIGDKLNYKYCILLRGEDYADIMEIIDSQCYVKISDMEKKDDKYIWARYFKRHKIDLSKAVAHSKIGIALKYNNKKITLYIDEFPPDSENYEAYILSKLGFTKCGNKVVLESSPPLNAIFIIKDDCFEEEALSNIESAVWTVIERSTAKAQKSAWDLAFSANYIDNNNCAAFLAYIEGLKLKYANNEYAALYTSIVNASGIGKSRLLSEMSLHRANVMFCCLRPLESSGIPARSLFASELLRIGENKSSCFYIERFCSYFVAAFTVFNKYDCPSVLEQQKEGYEMELKIEFELQFIHVRKMFTDSERPKSLKNIQGSLKDPNIGESLAVLSKWRKMLSDYISLHLQPKVADADKMNFFVFDEARAFISDSSDLNHTLFSYLRYSFSFLDAAAGINMFMGILLDTLSRVSDFQPSDYDASMRIPGKGTKLLDPYFAINTNDLYFTGIDLEKLTIAISSNDVTSYQEAALPRSINCKLKNSNWMVQQTGWRMALGFMAMGRPLWFSYLLGSLNAGIRIEHNLLNITQKSISFVKGLTVAKLDNRLKGNDFTDEMKTSMLSLVLGCRLKLNAVIAEKMISDLMASCFYISKTRNTIMCGYSSEPILADGALRLLNGKDMCGFVQNNLISAIKEDAKGGCIDQGEVGEVLARYILIQAVYHSQIINKSNTTLCGVSVLTFLNAFVTDPMKAMADIDSVLLSGTLLFNHFIPAEEFVGISDIYKYYARGAAILCKTNNPGVDFIIPIKLENGFSFVLVQVKFYSKNTFCDIKKSVLKCNPRACKLLEADISIPNPYLSIIMVLGSLESRIEIETTNAQTTMIIYGLSNYLPNSSFVPSELYTIDRLRTNKLAEIYDKNTHENWVYTYLKDVVDPIGKELTLEEPAKKKMRKE